MSQIILITQLSSFLVAHLFISGVVSTTFTVTNNCNYTVWPAIFSNPEASAFSTTGFSLEKDESKIMAAPASWRGRFWGRTYCSKDSAGIFSCNTGDCGSGKLECSGNVGAPPTTLAEFSIGAYNGLDFFNVSLVDGCNLPLLVVPSGQNCTSEGCTVDLNGACPAELKVTSSNGEIVACESERQTFGSPQYCASTDYQIIFCAVHAATNTRSRKLLAQGTGRYSRDSALISPYNRAIAPSPRMREEITPSPSPAYATVTKNETRSVTVRASSPRMPEETSPSPPPGTNTKTVNTSNNSQPPPPDITPSPPPRTNPPTVNTSSRKRLALTIAGVIGGALLIISLVVAINFRARWWMKRTIKSKEDVDDDRINLVPGMPVRFSYEDLRIATDDFKETLGRGGFGSVFKGVLADGTGIAVKRLDRLGQGKRAFLAEVETIGSLHHFNLVRLIGFCAEKSYTLLVYEYMSNGSLDNWIFKKNQRSSLDWQTRKKIILDIAKGLAYLHEDCRQTIMHLDIKPQNILLDPNFNAKISDFGLSKLIDRDMSQIQISMRGTPGYLAPEWRQPSGRITVKVDIYSFGIVLLEVVCARKNVDNSQPESAFHLLRMLQNQAEYVVDHLDDYMQSDREETVRMIKIAAWCLQDDPERRPPISTVVKVLEGVMEIDSNLVYKFSHALTSSAVVNQHISSAPMPASVLSYPR